MRRTFWAWHQQFVQQNEFCQPEWVDAQGIGGVKLPLYMHVRPTTIYRGAVEITHLYANVKGTGALRQFLDQYESDIPFVIHGIVNLRLARHLLGRGYILYCNKATIATQIDFAVNPYIQAYMPDLIHAYTERGCGYNIIATEDQLLRQIECTIGA